MSITCGYCGQPAKFEPSSAHIYGGRDYGPVWDCRPCDAYVGCHPDGSPKGVLANKTRRLARRRAHEFFDPLWQDWQPVYPERQKLSGKLRNLMRVRAYEWLAHHMGLPFDDTHIAMFDETQCERVVDLIREHSATAATVREWAKARRAA